MNSFWQIFSLIIGPIVVATWMGGRAADPSEPSPTDPARTSRLYVVTRSTQKFHLGGRNNPSVGLFVTSDRGKTWHHLGWHYTKCFSVAIVPGTRAAVLYLSCGNGIQKSSDGGQNWAIITDWKMTECLKLAIDPQNPGILYAATAYGIFKSTDSGVHWQEKNQGLKSTFTSSVLIDSRDSHHLLTATEAGIYESHDQGGTWQLLGLAGMGIRVLVQSSLSPGWFLAGTEDEGVFKSTDGGRTWHPANRGLSHLTIYTLSFDPQHKDVFYAGTFHGGVYKSINRGSSWRAINRGLEVRDIHALAVDPEESDVIYCGTLGGGIYLSEDGGEHWHFIGLETSQVWDLFIQQGPF